MTTQISRLADVSPRAQIGDDVFIGPFCHIGPHVKIGNGTVLDSHVSIVGHTTVGYRNRIFPNVVIGAEPQDVSFSDSPTKTIIGDENQIREGVTIHRGAEKEDHTTRVGSNCLLMANSHIAHNCNIGNNVFLVNGSLLGGHVHIHDGAIISGNSVVHHFSTIGTLAFVSGGCRVPHDVPPYMLAAGSDNPTLRTINIVGMKRRGIARSTISLVKKTFKLLYREHKSLDVVREMLLEELDGVVPLELSGLLSFVERQREGRMGRQREGGRTNPAPKNNENLDSQQERKVA